MNKKDPANNGGEEPSGEDDIWNRRTDGQHGGDRKVKKRGKERIWE